MTSQGSVHPQCSDIVSAHRRILGMASVVCVLVKICVSSISLYKLDTDKLATQNMQYSIQWQDREQALVSSLAVRGDSGASG